MTEVPANLADHYIAFFQKNPAGQYFVRQLESLYDSNITDAMNKHNLESLCQAKGNHEAIDLIDNVIKTKEAKPRQ